MLLEKAFGRPGDGSLAAGDRSFPKQECATLGRLPHRRAHRQIGSVIDPPVLELPLPDRRARERILTDLDTNLLVEAGAGSGKTTALVGRMVALLESGSAEISEIAAVTFTRKAAGELRERFQAELEERLRRVRTAVDPQSAEQELRLRVALDGIDRAFIGTIHSFCGRILRERPLDIGLDPDFEELPVEERVGIRAEFWRAYLERLARDSAPVLEDLARAGLRVSGLFELFDRLVENPDVEFPADALDPPDPNDFQALRATLEGIVDRAWELMDDVPPPRGWDSLQNKLRRIHFERDISGWDRPSDFFDAVALLCKTGSPHKTTFNRWRDKELTRSLVADINAFGLGDTPAQRLVDQWYAHRYALAIKLCRSAERAFYEHRLRIGKLDFQDLLVLSARLLREQPSVRRQLGRKWRRLLVDEFQDTDPLQAEIMLLLASDPDGGGVESAEESGDHCPDWRAVVPRDGALFVVGDPKQSIYRFRRADIELYGFVRDRFRDFGEVVVLTTNFRSRPEIGDLVNQLFAGEAFFPEKATREQAAFEPLDTRPPTEEVPCEGVFVYDIAPEQRSKAGATSDDALRLASWIRGRIGNGERTPGDFLILTRQRGNLDNYAAALEEYGVPVDVTGAGVGVAEELRELEVFLECMIDPTNPVRVVSTLVGLFFGLDYERLVSHRLADGAFDVMTPSASGDREVVAAVSSLHSWWRLATSQPADVFVTSFATEMGLLPLAASGDLGALRAGALVYALDAIRSAAYGGDSSLPGALRALRSALALREAEAPLEPGRENAVRLMNLHQAKGLEGTVVILANPTESRSRAPDIHIARSSEGEAHGFLRVFEHRGAFRSPQDLARPHGWRESEEAELRFDRAEEVRLLYVAVTRAREELVVSRWPGGKGASPWSSLDPWLDEHAEPLELGLEDAPERPVVARSSESISASIEEAKGAVSELARPTYTVTSVSRLAKAATESESSRSSSRPEGMIEASRALEKEARHLFRGFAWGTVVHDALALAARELEIEHLQVAYRDLLVSHQRPLDDHGEPTELDELVDLVAAVQGSELWRRAEASEERLVEVSFSTPFEVVKDAPKDPLPAVPSSAVRKQLDLFGTLGDGGGGEGEADPPSADRVDAVKPDAAASVGDAPLILEGVIDLAFLEDGGWVVADWKTDLGTDPHFESRVVAYRRQVETYAEAWSRLTGDRVKERILFFTTQGREERW